MNRTIFFLALLWTVPGCSDALAPGNGLTGDYVLQAVSGEGLPYPGYPWPNRDGSGQWDGTAEEVVLHEGRLSLRSDNVFIYRSEGPPGNGPEWLAALEGRWSVTGDEITFELAAGAAADLWLDAVWPRTGTWGDGEVEWIHPYDGTAYRFRR